MLDVRIKYNGVNVRLVGWGFKKFHNLKILEAGLRSVKERLGKGVGPDDGPTKPLTKYYARYKSKKLGTRAKRDLRLTGTLLDKELLPRYADDNLAGADASTRLGRLKLRNKYAKGLTFFSERDQASMYDVAYGYYKDGMDGIEQQFTKPLYSTAGSGLGKEGAQRARDVAKNRRTFFGRS